MAHLRDRHIALRFQKALKYSPSICLVGMRQSGKTTLLRKNATTYLTLDDDQTLYQLNSGNWGLIESAAPPVAIDECQKIPAVFDRVKLLVDQKKVMGRFLLTGSVRFLSKRQIRESLTGRTVILEMLPFLISESLGTPLKADFLSPNFGKKSLPIRVGAEDALKIHLERGGLPGICFRRDQAIRSDLMATHIETLLSRDIQLLYQTRLSALKLTELLREFALSQGVPVNHSLIAKKIGITSPTVAHLVDAFSALFLIRPFGKTLYLEDGGMAEHLSRGQLTDLQRLRSFVYRELLGRALYLFPGEVSLSEYRTRGGADVPVVWNTVKGDSIGFTVDTDPYPSERSLRSLESFIRAKPKRRGIALHAGDQSSTHRHGILGVPLHGVF